MKHKEFLLDLLLWLFCFVFCGFLLFTGFMNLELGVVASLIFTFVIDVMLFIAWIWLLLAFRLYIFYKHDRGLSEVPDYSRKRYQSLMNYLIVSARAASLEQEHEKRVIRENHETWLRYELEDEERRRKCRKINRRLRDEDEDYDDYDDYDDDDDDDCDCDCDVCDRRDDCDRYNVGGYFDLTNGFCGYFGDCGDGGGGDCGCGGDGGNGCGS